MQLTLNRRMFVLISLALLSLWAALLWAQTDTPIVIADGSLTIESRGVAWSRFIGTGGTRRHPDATKTVTSVELTVNGNSQTIGMNNQPCTVTAQYGKTKVTVASGKNGKGLRVSTDYKSFHQGISENHLAHIEEHNRIGAVTVKRGSQTVFTGTGSGGTVITIHYQ